MEVGVCLDSSRVDAVTIVSDRSVELVVFPGSLVIEGVKFVCTTWGVVVRKMVYPVISLSIPRLKWKERYD